MTSCVETSDVVVGDTVRVDMFGKNGTVVQIENRRIGLKLNESESVFWSPSELVRKDNEEAELVECLTAEIGGREAGIGQDTPLVSELERTSIKCDKDILKWHNKTEKINSTVTEDEEKLVEMEKKIKTDESGIELLTQQSITLASKLKKKEPAFESLCKVKSCVADIKSNNVSVQSSISKTGERIEKLESSKLLLEKENGELQQVAVQTTAKWKTRLVQSRHDIEVKLNQVCEGIALFNDGTQRLTEKVEVEHKKQEQEKANLQAAKDRMREVFQENKEIKQTLEILRVERNAANEKITFLKRATAMVARGKAFKFIPTINTIEKFLSNLENADVDTEDVKKAQDPEILERMILDLCTQNNSLKLELSKATTKLLKLMVDTSTSYEP